MWDPSKRSNICPSCSRLLIPKMDKKCVTCKRNKQMVVRCPEESCKFHHWICLDCMSVVQKSSSKSHDSAKNKENSHSDGKMMVVCGGILVAFIAYLIHKVYISDSSQNLQNGNEISIKNLKKDFPSQRNETWYHLLSVLEKDSASVKSITFLHGEDRRTLDCLTNKLIFLYSGNTRLKREEITFSKSGYEGLDYGFALEHYYAIVKSYRIFVTDLNTVPGNIARIFHSLCDEVSSEIKPSLFIFTLRFDERRKELKPLERATAILLEAWSDLPENEIFPLLSRVIKNVVEVVPEKEASC